MVLMLQAHDNFQSPQIGSVGLMSGLPSAALAPHGTPLATQRECPLTLAAASTMHARPLTHIVVMGACAVCAARCLCRMTLKNGFVPERRTQAPTLCVLTLLARTYQVPLEEVLALAAAAESGSEHPLASAVLDHAAAVFDISDPSLNRPYVSLATDRFNQGKSAKTRSVLVRALALIGSCQAPASRQVMSHYTLQRCCLP